MFEATISLGNLLSIMFMVASCVAVVWAVKGDLQVERAQRKTIEQRLDKIEAEIKELVKQVSEWVRHDERLNALEQRISALEEYKPNRRAAR